MKELEPIKKNLEDAKASAIALETAIKTPEASVLRARIDCALQWIKDAFAELGQETANSVEQIADSAEEK